MLPFFIMDRFYTYVLYSKDYDKIYIGYTANLENRIAAHNDKENRGWTKSFQPWIIVYTEEFSKKGLALKREKQLKSAKGREFIWNEIISKIKSS
jgi:putative endonuclease